MKSFKEFLNESSLSRIKSKADKRGIAIMSADRGDKSRKENKARAKQLEKDEKTGKERKVKEKSYVIDRGKLSKKDFKKKAKKLGIKHKRTRC